MLRFYCPELCPSDVSFPYLAEIVIWFSLFYLLIKLVAKVARA
jgi:hypothetical protein